MSTSQTAYEFKNHKCGHNYFQDPQNDLKYKPLSRRPDSPSLDCFTVAQELDVLPCWVWLQGPFTPQGTPANSSLAAALCASRTSTARFPQALGMHPGASKSPQCPCLAF